MRTVLVITLAVCGLLLAPAGPASADVLYTQPWDGTGNAYASQNDTGPYEYGNFATTFDNFTLGATSTVNNVQWAGTYWDQPPQGTITGFTLTFYADNAGSPDGALLSVGIPGTAGETSLGAPNYAYNADLPVPFTAAGGTQYWLSIVPDIAFPPQWGWATGTDGDGVAFQVFQGYGYPVEADMAFTLNGSSATVPEPSILVALAGLGGMSLTGLAWRRRKTA
jgi:hypothetical protein